MQTKLPVVLGKEPLVEAIFEVRLNGAPSLSDILPGFLFSQLKNPKPVSSRLPAADIPAPMRANDPLLLFTPVQRLDWGMYLISVGDRNFVVSCKLPYPKWPSFRQAIFFITQQIQKLDIPGEVERYSLKYVNLIQAPSPREQLEKIQVEVQLGSTAVGDQGLQLRVEQRKEETLHIISVATDARVVLHDGQKQFGAIVDVDSIRSTHFPNFNSFVVHLEKELDHLRYANKEQFFSCLKPQAIEEMEPEYEQ